MRLVCKNAAREEAPELVEADEAAGVLGARVA
jgi:hypothetical protein